MIVVYMTAGNREEAEKIARGLLDKRLIACANIMPVDSMYWWQDKISHEPEFAIICKSTEGKFSEIQDEVKRLHSYDLPCIESWKAEASREYADWVAKEVK
ncbi:MAG: divalent-cation tolerance protein CutA [archaeon]